MNNPNSNKEIKFIFLPNFNISSTFNSGSIGVFIGIITGIIINLLVDNEWKSGKVVFLISSVISSILLSLANKQNSIVKELCEDIKFKDQNNKFKTVNSVLNELWSQQNLKNKYVYRKHKYRFYTFLSLSFIIVILSAVFYVFQGNLQNKEIVKPEQTIIINDTLNLQNCQQSKIDSIHK